MEILIEQSERLLNSVSLDFRRYLFSLIRWDNRLIGIKGARGTGKTTLILQWLKMQNLPATRAAYFSLDDLYFTTNSLKETIDEFYKKGGNVVLLDEVHKYKNWAQEIKNIYDFYPGLKIIFTGSSIIDITRRQSDLSRRALIYELHGMSFREYLQFTGVVELPVIAFEELIKNTGALNKYIKAGFKPLSYFNEYIQRGYYPFFIEDPESVFQRINQLIRTIIEYDMAELKDFDIRNAKKLLQLLYIIAQQVPFKPNLSSLAEKSSIHRNSLTNYLYFLEQARLINTLYAPGRSVAVLKKPEKIYLNNTNLQYALAEDKSEPGSARETFFLSQLYPAHRINMPRDTGDFLVNNKYLFEIGGKGKKLKQINGIENAWLVKDDLELPTGNAIPLWMFGLLY